MSDSANEGNFAGARLPLSASCCQAHAARGKTFHYLYFEYSDDALLR